MKNYDNEETNKIKNNSSIYASFDNAIEGIVESINTERNMKIHLVSALLILLISFFLDFSRLELIIVFITIALVIAFELINTAIETLTDMVVEGKYSKLAKKVKDISAGTVLIMAINSVVVAYLIIYPKIKNIFVSKSIYEKVMINYEHLAVLSLTGVIVTTILLKGIFYKKNTTFLVGGIVSGHSAIAFNMATIFSIIVGNLYLNILFFVLAIAMAISRVKYKFHTKKEVILGSLLGISIALLFFIKYI